jgi:5-enolpyruvylshikimate-3-phosphate synthase
MRERPIQDLVDGLVQLGVDAKCTLGTGCPPVEVNAKGLPSGKVSGLDLNVLEEGADGWALVAGLSQRKCLKSVPYCASNGRPSVNKQGGNRNHHQGAMAHST